MISFDRVIRPLLSPAAFLIARAACSAAFGEDDDVTTTRSSAASRYARPCCSQAQFNPEQIDQWVFSQFWRSAVATRARLDANLGLRIDDSNGRVDDRGPEEEPQARRSGGHQTLLSIASKI